MPDKYGALVRELRRMAEHPPEPAELAEKLREVAGALEADGEIPAPDTETGSPDAEKLKAYALLANLAEDAITLLTRDYRYAAVNRAFLELLPPEMGNPVGEHVATVWGRDSFERSIRPALERCFEGCEVNYELWLNPPGKTSGYYKVRCKPCRDESGRVTHVSVTTRDATALRHATDAAIKSEDLYRNLVENINEVIFTMERDGQLSYVSPNVEKLTGFSPSYYIGTLCWEHMHPDDIDSAKQAAELVMNGTMHDAEIRCVRADGSYLWVRVSSHPLMENGQVSGLTGTVVDITESREARLALVRSERKYRDIYQNIQDVYFEMDLDGTILEASPSATRLTGYAREELVGHNVLRFYKHRDEYQSMRRKLFARREVRDFGVELINSEGRAVSCLVSAIQVVDQERGGFKVVGSVHDVSALKKAEAELQQANAFLESLVDTVPDPIWVKGEDHVWRVVNSALAELLGHSKEFLQGKSVFDIFPEEQARHFRDKDQQVFDGGGRATHEEEFWDTGGVWHVISTNKAVLEAPGEPQRLLVGVMRDVTEQKRFEEMLWRAKEDAESLAGAKSRFLANMSHEIRTPLNGVIGMLQLMLAGDLDSRQAEYAATAMSSAHGLLTVINDVLDLSKIEAGKMEIVETHFDVREIVESVVQSLSRAGEGKSVAIRSSVVASVPPQLFGGGARIRQILFNLLGNALKFTQGGHVQVEVSWLPPDGNGKQRLLICVEDTGVGIADARLAYVCDAFVQADESHTREYQGAGLGLSIVQRLVHLMGGSVSLMSEEGRGTTVCVTVQAEEAVGAKVPEVRRVTDANKALPFRLALVVEDNAVNRILACRFLDKFGIASVAVNNGMQALAELEKRAGTSEAIDLVLMDIQMPVLDGLEATRRIRDSSRPEIAGLPIVALTAHAMEGDRERFLEGGMDGYAAKPLVLEELRDVLAGLPGVAR